MENLFIEKLWDEQHKCKDSIFLQVFISGNIKKFQTNLNQFDIRPYQEI